ncbi:MAG: hypothetical protein QNJ46_14715 [Leptolyngbyaceae cyanobacterium MO_188.B28]|nr:hypothetical protein [Leptolyngbyaceae cyanobacterium MO_188.B28]
MKAEYDFSKGERGKFYNAQAEFKLPIYLEPTEQAMSPGHREILVIRG